MRRSLQPASATLHDPRAGLLDRVAHGAAVVGAAAAVALGVFGRFNGLGDSPLAVDEYYFVQSVRAILEHGVPAFETGGYYSRGLLAQYLTAASILLFGDNGFAYRLPAALFSIGTVPLAYIYGRRILGPTGGLALAGLLLVSGWHIEFGRFARMYSGLQFFTVMFFIALDKTLSGRSGWRAYLPHLVLLGAILTHELAFLLIPFLFLPIVPAQRGAPVISGRRPIAYAAVTLAVVFLCYYYFTTDLRDSGVIDPLPADYESTGGRSRWRLPPFPAFAALHPGTVLMTYLVSAMLLVTGYFGFRRVGWRVPESWLLGGLMVLSAAFHQFFMAGAIFLLLLARHGLGCTGRERLGMLVLVAAAMSIGVFWLAYAFVATESILATALPGDGPAKATARMLFGWPDVTSAVIGPWRVYLPLLGACTVVAFVYQLATKARSDIGSWLRNPAVPVAGIVLALGTFHQPYATIRYSFFIYPFVLALILMSAMEAAAAILRKRTGDPRLGAALGAVVCAIMFGLSSDFNLRQITHVAAPDVRLRLGQFEQYQGLWYDRLDYQTPALFVNEHAQIQNAERILVVGQPPVSYYLAVPHGVYYDRTDPRFYGVSRRGGTVDLWSNQRLLSTPHDLLEYTRCAGKVWIIRATSPNLQAFDTETVWGSRVAGSAAAFLSLDRRLEVRLMELETKSGC